MLEWERSIFILFLYKPIHSNVVHVWIGTYDYDGYCQIKQMSYKMAPNVKCFVVEHEHGGNNSPQTYKMYPVPRKYILIVNIHLLKVLQKTFARWYFLLLSIIIVSGGLCNLVLLGCGLHPFEIVFHLHTISI